MNNGYEPTHIQMQGKTINECTTGGIFDENMRETEFLKINHALVAQLKLKFDLEKAIINPNEVFDVQKGAEMLEEEWNTIIGNRAIMMEKIINTNKHKNLLMKEENLENEYISHKNGQEQSDENRTEHITNPLETNESNTNINTEDLIQNLYSDLDSFIITLKY